MSRTRTNTTSTNTSSTNTVSGDVEQAGSQAVARAQAGAEAWADAARLQLWASADHADFYALAGAVVPTLYALEDLANALRRQVEGYGVGRRVYDDSGTVDPAVRLGVAAEHLALLRDALAAAHREANHFWSAIGHIGVDPDPTEVSADEDGEVTW